MPTCLNCQNTAKNKFCSSSCSGKYNSRRPKLDEVYSFTPKKGDLVRINDPYTTDLFIVDKNYLGSTYFTTGGFAPTRTLSIVSEGERKMSIVTMSYKWGE